MMAKVGDWDTEVLGDDGGWTVDSGVILCCCVFSVKQLVMSRKGRISEEIRSKDHLRTYRSCSGFRREREWLKQCLGLKRSDVSGPQQQRLTPSWNGRETSICSFLYPQSLPFPVHTLDHFLLDTLCTVQYDVMSKFVLLAKRVLWVYAKVEVALQRLSNVYLLLWMRVCKFFGTKKHRFI